MKFAVSDEVKEIIRKWCRNFEWNRMPKPFWRYDSEKDVFYFETASIKGRCIFNFSERGHFTVIFSGDSHAFLDGTSFFWFRNQENTGKDKIPDLIDFEIANPENFREKILLTGVVLKNERSGNEKLFYF